ncbi:MAG: integrase [Amaricoccus sp.]|uniref:tyrosine-type recombinase/integrase n=1 Tax=Amaricoccus sp. TaxID=1872485 RepID=UPI0039E3306C
MATVVRRGRKWNVQVARLGVRKSATFASKAEAVAWGATAEAETLNGAIPTERESNPPINRVPVTASAGETFGDLIDRYSRELKGVKRWGRTKEFSLAAIKARIGRVSITDLNSDLIVDFAQKRAAEGAGPVTVQMDLAYIGNVLKVARVVWRKPIARDVVADARESLKLLGLVGKSRQRNRIAKDAELAAVKLAWRSNVPTSIIDFAVLSCMRLSEIVALSVGDREGSAIWVRDRKHPTEKYGNDQLVPLLNGAAELLDGLEVKGGRYFPFPADTVGAAWQRACKRAKVTDLHFHDLRHTGLTRLRKQGLGIPELAVVSGHRDWKMLQRYVNLNADDLLSLQLGKVSSK